MSNISDNSLESIVSKLRRRRVSELSPRERRRVTRPLLGTRFVTLLDEELCDNGSVASVLELLASWVEAEATDWEGEGDENYCLSAAGKLRLLVSSLNRIAGFANELSRLPSVADIKAFNRDRILVLRNSLAKLQGRITESLRVLESQVAVIKASCLLDADAARTDTTDKNKWVGASYVAKLVDADVTIRLASNLRYVELMSAISESRGYISQIEATALVLDEREDELSSADSAGWIVPPSNN